MLKEASEQVAERVLGDILRRLVALPDFPDQGVSRSVLRPGLRAVLVRPYLAYYVVAGSEIRVLRVLHGARDIEGLTASGGLDV